MSIYMISYIASRMHAAAQNDACGCMRMHVCMHTVTHACVYVCMYACVYGCMDVCIHACMVAYTHAHVCVWAGV